MRRPLAGTLPLLLALLLCPLALRSAAAPKLALLSGISGKGEAWLLRGGERRPLVTGMHLLRGDRVEGRGATVVLSLLDLDRGALVSQTLDPGSPLAVASLLSGEKPSLLSRLYRGVSRLFEGDEEAVGRVGGAQAGLMHDPTMDEEELDEAPEKERPAPCPPPPSRNKRKRLYESPPPPPVPQMSDRPHVDLESPTRSRGGENKSLFSSLPPGGASSNRPDGYTASRSDRPPSMSGDEESLDEEFAASPPRPSKPRRSPSLSLQRPPAEADAMPAPRRKPDHSVRSFSETIMAPRQSGRIVPLGRLRFLHRAPKAGEGRPFLAIRHRRGTETTRLPRLEMSHGGPLPFLEVDLRHRGFLVGDLLVWEIRSYEGRLLEGPHRARIVSPARWVPVRNLEREAKKRNGAERRALFLLAAQAWERLGDLRRASRIYDILAATQEISPRDRRTFRDGATRLRRRLLDETGR